jgi:hypothetical protein
MHYLWQYQHAQKYQLYLLHNALHLIDLVSQLDKPMIQLKDRERKSNVKILCKGSINKWRNLWVGSLEITNWENFEDYWVNILHITKD